VPDTDALTKRGPLTTVVKPWGGEELLAHTEDYALKRIRVNKGEGSSLQYHNQKTESLYMVSGLLQFEIGKTEDSLVTLELGPGECVDIPAGIIHRTLALEDVDVIEVSTPHLDDVVRLQDKYGR
jgi:mannose-6-phosphate isomerase